jgi:hypothetical protein
MLEPWGHEECPLHCEVLKGWKLNAIEFRGRTLGRWLRLYKFNKYSLHDQRLVTIEEERQRAEDVDTCLLCLCVLPCDSLQYSRTLPSKNVDSFPQFWTFNCDPNTPLFFKLYLVCDIVILAKENGLEVSLIFDVGYIQKVVVQRKPK